MQYVLSGCSLSYFKMWLSGGALPVVWIHLQWLRWAERERTCWRSSQMAVPKKCIKSDGGLQRWELTPAVSQRKIHRQKSDSILPVHRWWNPGTITPSERTSDRARFRRWNLSGSAGGTWADPQWIRRRISRRIRRRTYQKKGAFRRKSTGGGPPAGSQRKMHRHKSDNIPPAPRWRNPPEVLQRTQRTPLEVLRGSASCVL